MRVLPGRKEKMMRNKWKWIMTSIMASAICFSSSAGDIKTEWSGPSAQGDLIFWAPSTGTTNMRMTVNGVSNLTIIDKTLEPADFALASGKVIVGDAGGAGEAVTLSGDVSLDNAGAFTVTQINSIAVSDVTDGAALGATSLQTAGNLTATNLLGPFVFTYATTAKVAYCTAQISDIDGAALARGGFADVWTCETTAQSDPTTNNVESIAIRSASGSFVYTMLTNGYYKAVIPSDGKLEFDVTYTAARTSDFIVVAIGGALESTTVLNLTD